MLPNDPLADVLYVDLSKRSFRGCGAAPGRTKASSMTRAPESMAGWSASATTCGWTARCGTTSRW